MKQFGIAILGCGEISTQTADAIIKTGKGIITKVVSTNHETAVQVANKYNADAVDNFEAALNDPLTNAVYIATPHFLHADQACMAASAGKHLFIEKPIAIKDADAERIIQTCRKNSVQAAVMFINRYSPHAIMAKKLIESGSIGKIITIQHAFMQDRRKKYWTQGVSGKAKPTYWRGSKEKAGGGNLIMNGSHNLDLIMHITSLMPVRVFAEMDTFVHNVEVEDMLCSTIRFDNRAIATADFGTAAVGRGADMMRFIGNKGQIDIPDIWGDKIRLFTLDGFSDYQAEVWHDIPVNTNVDYRYEFMKDALEVFGKTGKFPVSSEDGRKCLRVINAIYKSAESHCSVELTW